MDNNKSFICSGNKYEGPMEYSPIPPTPMIQNDSNVHLLFLQKEGTRGPQRYQRRMKIRRNADIIYIFIKTNQKMAFQKNTTL